jgi:hypothetical protein
VATDQPLGKGQRWIELKVPGAVTRGKFTILKDPDGNQLVLGSK